MKTLLAKEDRTKLRQRIRAMKLELKRMEKLLKNSKDISTCSKKEAQAFLVKLGSHTKTGRLTKPYR